MLRTSGINTSPENFQKLSEPSGMRWPGRCGDEFPAGVCLIHCEGFILPAGSCDLRAYCWIATARFALEHTSRCQYLRSVTDRSNRFVRICEMANDFQNARIEPKVLRRPATGNYERVVVIGANLVEGRIQSEIVTSLLTVGLVALEIVDGGPYQITSPLIRTDGMDDVPYHEKRLEGNHHFVIFNIIANEHEEFLGSHDKCSPAIIVALLRVWREF